MQNPNVKMDLAQVIFSLIFIIVVGVTSFLVVRPFISTFIWASMLVIVTWPIMLKIQNFLGGRRYLAIAILLTMLSCLFAFPVFFVIHSLIDTSIPLLHWLRANTLAFPELMWLQDIPLIGKKAFVSYQELLNGDSGGELFHALVLHFARTTEFFFIQAKNIGLLIVQSIFLLFVSVLLYWNGEKIACSVRDFACRVNASNGDAIIILSVQAIRSVALGVLVAALIQAVLSGVSLLIAGIPYWTLIMVLMVFSCLFQLGPLPILVPSIIWLFWQKYPNWGTSLLIWSFFLCILDNIIRSVLIRMGADLPILLILFGVIGGLISFGMIGLFIGPVVLVISYRLLISWMYGVPMPVVEKKEWIKKMK